MGSDALGESLMMVDHPQYGLQLKWAKKLN